MPKNAQVPADGASINCDVPGLRTLIRGGDALFSELAFCFPVYYLVSVSMSDNIMGAFPLAV